MQEVRLLARGTVIIDPQGIVQYVEYVPEITQEPDYEAAFKAFERLFIGFHGDVSETPGLWKKQYLPGRFFHRSSFQRQSRRGDDPEEDLAPEQMQLIAREMNLFGNRVFIKRNKTFSGSGILRRQTKYRYAGTRRWPRPISFINSA